MRICKAFSKSTLIVLVYCCLLGVIQAQISEQTTQNGDLSASKIYQTVLPSVVLITVRTQTGIISGSGVVLRSDGVIATNYHIAAGAVSARVQFSNGDVYDDVSILDFDDLKDIAILKIKATKLPTVSIADSNQVAIGETVYAIGAPQGLTGTLSNGIISGIRSISELEPKLSGFRVIQFTAPISPGSSGGALLNAKGEVIALPFASRTESQNINVAVPINYVAPLVAAATGGGTSLERYRQEVASSTEAISPKPDTKPSKQDLAGIYTGQWQSDEWNVSGVLVMKLTFLGENPKVTISLTGSDYVKGDTLDVSLTEIGNGLWQMTYKGTKTKFSGIGLFRGQTFVGDYKFKKLFWTDRGRWVLKKD